MKTYKFYYLLLTMLLAMPIKTSAAYKANENYLDSLTKVAEQGDVETQLLLGIFYSDWDWGKKKDYTEAAKWYRKAAEQGNSAAQERLGSLYCLGKGVRQDSVEAEKWYRKAAEQGYAPAQFDLGLLYYGNKGKQDYAEAAKWWRKAAEQGYWPAQHNLGLCYKDGLGVKQDYVEAAKWCRKAAEQGFDYAQNILGDFYAQGQGVKQDYVEAAKWYHKTAEQGNGKAKIKLGLFYALGKGVKQNCSEAVNLIYKGIKELLKPMGILALNLGFLLLFIIAYIFFYKKNKKIGLKKSQLIILSLIDTCFLIPIFIILLPLFLVDTSLDSVDYFKLAYVPIAILLVISFIKLLLVKKWKNSSKTDSTSSESKNEASEDTLIDGIKGHKVKFDLTIGEIINFVWSALAMLVGLPYFGYVTKALGYEPLSHIVDWVHSFDTSEFVISLIISVLIFALALFIGIMLSALLKILIHGWRKNTAIKKNRYILGLLAPILIAGLLPLLASPFVNNIEMFFFGVIFIDIAIDEFAYYAWKLRKELRDCMIMEIEDENAIFVLDEDQIVDNEDQPANNE